jgi:hypothetical protein
MMRMQLERRSHAGYPDLAGPKFFCDFCNRPIQRAGLGLYMWDERLENAAYFAGEPTAVYTVHKGKCDALMCSVLGLRQDEVATMELEVLPLYLARNMGMHSHEELEKGRDLADLGGAA